MSEEKTPLIKTIMAQTDTQTDTDDEPELMTSQLTSSDDIAGLVDNIW